MADDQSTIDRPRKRPWLRRVCVVVGCLLAGAIINVFVAWGCVVSETRKMELPRPIALIEFFDNREWTYISYDRALGFTRHALFETFHDPEFELERTSQYLKARLNGEDLHERIIEFPRWSRLGVTARDPLLEVEHEIAAGWPMRGLWGSQYEIRQNPETGESQRNYNPSSSLRINRWTISKFGQYAYNDRQLPLVPIWPGFLINMVFYGAIVWTLFATPRAVRRHRRAKRRQCPACGYPVGTSAVCTECGEAVKTEKC